MELYRQAREGFYLLCSLLLDPPLACGPCLGRGMRGASAVSSDEGPYARHASRALRRACGQRARSGSESLYGSAWFGSVWGGFLGEILGGIARAGFSHRESALPDPLNY